MTRAHLEEDAGKSIHEAYPGMTGIDLNRAGTPLLEIVSEPDLRTAAEAAAYFRQLHSLVRHLKICDGNLAEGSMRCDANVSVRRRVSTNSVSARRSRTSTPFRFLELAINYEIERQIELIEAGGTVTRETRLYDSDATKPGPCAARSCPTTTAIFRIPDLLPVLLDEAFIESVRAELPELPAQMQARFESEHGLSNYDAAWLTSDPEIAAYFETAAAPHGCEAGRQLGDGRGFRSAQPQRHPDIRLSDSGRETRGAHRTHQGRHAFRKTGQAAV